MKHLLISGVRLPQNGDVDQPLTRDEHRRVLDRRSKVPVRSYSHDCSFRLDIVICTRSPPAATHVHRVSFHFRQGLDELVGFQSILYVAQLSDVRLRNHDGTRRQVRRCSP